MSIAKIYSALSLASKVAGVDEFVDSIIVCDGNSLTRGGGTTPYPQQVSERFPFSENGTLVYNKGVDGQTTPQMIADASTDIDPLYNASVKSVLIAWEVGNDIYFNGSVLNAYNNFVTYCNDRRLVGWKVIAISLTPRDQSTPFGDNSAQFEVKLQQANVLMLNNWIEFSDAIIDLRSDPRLATITLDYWNPDLVHLNAAGYQVVADLVMKKILTV